jgi:hypothetical protein
VTLHTHLHRRNTVVLLCNNTETDWLSMKLVLYNLQSLFNNAKSTTSNTMYYYKLSFWGWINYNALSGGGKLNMTDNPLEIRVVCPTNVGHLQLKELSLLDCQGEWWYITN